MVHQQLIRCPNLELVEVEDEWIVFNANNYTITKMNDTAGHILSALDHPMTQHDLIENVNKTYEGVTSELEDDIQKFLEQLSEIGLVMRV